MAGQLASDWAGVEEASIETEAPALFSEEVAEGVRRRDPEAISAVYEALADRLLGFLVARVGDRQAAEDLLESTFIELLERGFTIRGGPRVIKSWLFRAAHFNALDHLRKRQRGREDLVGDHYGYDRADLAPGPEDTALHADLSRELRHALAQLSDDQQEVLLLRYVAGLTAPEVAAVVDKNVPAVRGLQHRGERSLARILEREAETPAPVEVLPSSKQRGRLSSMRRPEGPERRGGGERQ